MAEERTSGERKPILEIKLNTSGSCQFSFADIIDIGSGGKHDLVHFTRYSNGRLPFDFINAEYVNNDSRKNVHRAVYIYGTSRPVIVYVYGAGSCNPKSKFEEAYLIEGNNVEKLEVKKEEAAEVVDNENEKYRAAFLVTYVDTKHGRVVINKEFIRVLETLDVKKIPLTVVYDNNRNLLVVSGKTFHIKDRLKALGFKFGGSDWSMKVDKEHVKSVVEEIKKIPKVIVMNEYLGDNQSNQHQNQAQNEVTA